MTGQIFFIRRLAILLSLMIFLLILSSTAMADNNPTSSQWQKLDSKKLKLRSQHALIVDQSGNPVYGKSSDSVSSIASITKVMTAMVVLDAKLPLDEKITITKADRDLIQQTGSRLKYGATLSRKEMLQLALMSSENRAATALGRTFPGGLQGIIKAMNNKAKSLGMSTASFADPAGLKPENQASARDLLKMLQAADQYPLIQEATAAKELTVKPWKNRGTLRYVNTNRLVKNKKWDIALSKTGYINEAGRCLIMKTEIVGEPMYIVLLNSFGKLTPFGDANRIRKWIESGISSS